MAKHVPTWLSNIGVVVLTIGCSGPTENGTHCYEFRTVGESCYGVVATLWGCQDHSEYKWKSKCLGYIPDAYYENKRYCFEDALKNEGACTEGRSLPKGGSIPSR